mgnify:CR=1 FL=1
MWRIYSPKSNAVRIRTTVRKLFDSLDQSEDKLAKDQVFIGRVDYLRSKKLQDFADDILNKLPTTDTKLLPRTLLVKRPAFRHEREVRLLYVPYEKAQATPDIWGYGFEPNMLIDQIMIDPRVTKEQASELKEKIREKTRFSGVIKHSMLYAPPPDFLTRVV